MNAKGLANKNVPPLKASFSNSNGNEIQGKYSLTERPTQSKLQKEQMNHEDGFTGLKKGTSKSKERDATSGSKNTKLDEEVLTKLSAGAKNL